MKQYIIDEKDLLYLIEEAMRLRCLEQDGVDNWVGYMESKKDFIKEELESYGIVSVDEDFDFEDLAKLELRNYKEV